MSILAPFQLLELNVISAQDLAPVSRSMRTYAIAWVHPDRKLSTRVDTHGHNNPTWNDKFVFRVDEDFLHEDTSAVMIEIYALHWFKDVHVGTIRVLVGNLIQTPAKPHHHHPQLGMRFVALQVRRPSGRPQGILNIGVALLHSSMRSMPLYSQLNSSAVGYKQLMGEDDPPRSQTQQSTFSKPELRRSKSDCSSMLGSDLRSKEFNKKDKKGSSKSSSVVSGSEVSGRKYKKGRSKASSLINGSELIKGRGRKGKASSVVSASDVSWKGKKGKASSILSVSDLAPKIGGKEKKGKASSLLSGSDPKPNTGSEPDESVRKHKNNGKYKVHDIVAAWPLSKPSPKYVESYGTTPARRSSVPGKSPFKMGTYETPRKSNLMAVPYLTESELGPSPSEVAAAIARERVDQDNESSVVVGAWNEDESVEGLQSKLERWRTELPPVYDRGDYSSLPSSSEGRHTRRHTDGGNGLFSCFSNICGVECSIVCGGSGEASKERKKAGSSSKSSGRVRKSPSADDMSYV
ncbi:PREDICTED: uncharacterized protein LOC101311957 [Fragaria vesca subsp. vesca]|uniref:uncharacterized protein LOC101311957 n=1 Tax=Fragaria vesca subsp. vesca TaxID=101020 RepID=UPI0002C36954|nr:PREDICTED: uncharacterized protein LOC101311957 [Fragaria vesca subsp. vesca]